MATSAGKKGIGIIGYGGFGEFIRAAWDKMDNAHVIAVCDADPTRAPIDGTAFYTQVDELLADDQVDIVSIATPPSSHKELAIRVMRAGKHALIEKPVALNVEDAEEIKRVAQETQRVATVNFVLRYNPLVEMLKEIISSEVFGKLMRVDLRNYAMQETVPEGHWFWNPDISGRILLEHGVHFFDLASWMIEAKAEETWSLGVERKPGMEDRVFATVKYENGVVGTYWHSFSRPRELETTTFHFSFDLGEIEMVGWIPLELSLWGWTGEPGLEKLESLLDESEVVVDPLLPQKAHSSDRIYDVEYEINTAIEMEEPKMEVYAEGVRSIMADMIEAIDDPAHKMRVTIDEAIEAVRIAEQATNVAHPKG
jgi:predicted dehydrogenase